MGAIIEKQNPKIIQVCTTNKNIQILAQYTYISHKIQVTQHLEELGFREYVKHL
jgi:hypothetical protein